jgi:hypothetical protein
MKTLLGLGFVFANVENGDANIPDQPIKEEEENALD